MGRLGGGAPRGPGAAAGRGRRAVDAGHVDAPGSQTLEELAGQARDVVREAFTFETVDAAVEAMRGQAVRWSPAMDAAWRESFGEVDGAAVPTLAAETYAAAYRGFQRRPPSSELPALGRPGCRCCCCSPASRRSGSRAAGGRGGVRRAGAAGPAPLDAGPGHNLVAEIGAPLGDELADWLAEAGWR